jgi:hypothetical protein
MSGGDVRVFGAVDGLAKSASPAFLRGIYQKIAVRYVFMAEELLRGPERDVDAVETADQMTSRLRLDGGA